MSKKPGVVVVPPEEEMLTLKETAGYFATDEKTISRWVDEVPEFPRPVPLPAFKRKHLRFYRSEISAFKEFLRTHSVKRIKKKFSS